MESTLTANAENPGSVRRLVSKRDISITAYELQNGHVMLESAFLDPYHLIRLHLKIDPATRIIVESECEMANHPHSVCPQITDKARTLTGLTVGRGITKEISRRIGGSEGCVHLRELAFDTVNFGATVMIGYDEGFGLMSRDFNILDEQKRYDLSRHVLKNTCHVYKER
jgi:hypothetical protein